MCLPTGTPRLFLVAAAFYLYNSFVTSIPVYWIRHLYLKKILGLDLGHGSSIHMGCFITGRGVSVGSGTVVNRKVHLDGRGTLIIGNNVSISPEAYVLTMTHEVNSADFAGVKKTTCIEDYGWIGVRAIILPGVRIGKGAVVGAGAVVTRDVAPFTIVAGSPARKIGERKTDLRYTPKYQPYFDTDIGVSPK
jgi:acetyltransferase-like isoleucine patch superfamily enzyme